MRLLRKVIYMSLQIASLQVVEYLILLTDNSINIYNYWLIMSTGPSFSSESVQNLFFNKAQGTLEKSGLGTRLHLNEQLRKVQFVAHVNVPV